MKVFIVGGPEDQYARMFLERGWSLAPTIFEADLVQFTGGEDVTPAIYNEENTYSHNSWYRDLNEAGYFAIAKRLGKPMAGICRGGQFLNVMCGGKMIQHVDGHATGKTHLVYSHNDQPVDCTSTHHQMMVEGNGGDVIGWAEIVCDDDETDAEVIHYHEDDVLCFQPHPEFHNGECQDYYFELLESQLGLKV